MMQNYSIIVEKRRNRSQTNLRQINSGLQSNRYDPKARANSIKDSNPR